MNDLELSSLSGWRSSLSADHTQFNRSSADCRKQHFLCERQSGIILTLAQLLLLCLSALLYIQLGFWHSTRERAMSVSRIATKAIAKATATRAVVAPSSYAATKFTREQSTTSIPNFSSYKYVPHRTADRAGILAEDLNLRHAMCNFGNEKTNVPIERRTPI